MENYFGLHHLQSRPERRKIREFAACIGVKKSTDPSGLEQIRISGRVQSIAVYAGSQPMKPQRQPPTLEARVTRDQNARAGIDIAKTEVRPQPDYQTFQGAAPEAQSSSS